MKILTGSCRLYTAKWYSLLCFSVLLATTAGAQKKDTISYIQTLDITSGKIDTVLAVHEHYEAPNWHPGGYLLMNKAGRLYKLDLATKAITPLNTGSSHRVQQRPRFHLIKVARH